MALDFGKIKALAPIPAEQDWRKRDTILYALGIAAQELDFTYEDRLKALPGMICVLAYPGFVWRNDTFGLDWKKILHVEQEILLHAPMPVEGRITGKTVIDAVVDKGAQKGAILFTSREIRDQNGVHFATARSATIARGDGGFATADAPGDAPPWPVLTLPDRAPDCMHVLETAQGQALLYRLSGDLNPLHIDPEVAQSAGFDRPILHGMCTFGVASRALLAELCGNDPARFRSMRCRFSAPVYPGETIRTEIWHTGEGVAAFRAIVEERDVTVLSGGQVTYTTEET